MSCVLEQGTLSPIEKIKTFIHTVNLMPFKCIVGFIFCAAALLFPMTTRADSDWAGRAISFAADLRNQAAQAVTRAEKRLQTAQADLSAAHSALTSAQGSNNAEAVSIAQEAGMVAQDELRLAQELHKKAATFLAEREQVLAYVRKAALSADRTTRGILVPEKGGVKRFAADGAPITDNSQPIRPGEQITTDANGQARLFVSKGEGRVLLQKSCSITIDQDDDTGFMASLNHGLADFRALVGKWVNKKFSVRTPAAVTSARGTAFTVTAAKDKTIVQVSEGHVVVTPSNGKGPLTLGPGECASVTPEGITKTVSVPGKGTGPEIRE